MKSLGYGFKETKFPIGSLVSYIGCNLCWLHSLIAVEPCCKPH